MSNNAYDYCQLNQYELQRNLNKIIFIKTFRNVCNMEVIFVWHNCIALPDTNDIFEYEK